MVSNIIYRAVPHPMEEVLTDSISDNDILHQYTSQIIFKAAHIAVEPDDISICTMSTESLNSEVAHVCIDSCDSLEETNSNAANLNKRKARPKRVKKQLNNLTFDPINRVPLDVMYGNSLLNENTGLKQHNSSTNKDSPLFLSITEMLDFDQISQTPNKSTTPEQESISLKRSERTFYDNPIPNGKRKKISNHPLSPQVGLNQFSLEINNIKINRTALRREMKLIIGKLSLKNFKLKLKKLLVFPSSQTLQITPNFSRVPMLNLQRITQLSSI